MKKLFIVFFLVITAAACGGSSNGSIDSKTYSASNIIFRSANASGLVKQSNTDETIYADQVVLDDGLGLAATTVQEAFAEITPELSTAIVGQWSITEVTQEAGDTDKDFTKSGGTITFLEDGTYSTSDTSGDTGFFEKFQLDDRYDSQTLTYSVIDGLIISLKAHNVLVPTCSADCEDLDDTPIHQYNFKPLIVYRLAGGHITLGNDDGFVILTKN